MRLMIGSILVIAICLCGCQPQKGPSTRSTRTSPDNSSVNQRDATGASKTPFDQGETAADREMTAKIRRRVVDLPGASINAQNVKIITAAGKVTLRGPVADEQERELIARIANEVAGEPNVDNQLEVTAP